MSVQRLCQSDAVKTAATIRLAGESNERPGYATLVRLFAPGYIRGLEQSAF